MSNIDQQIQEEIKRIKRDALEVDEDSDDFKVVWTSRDATEYFEASDNAKILKPTNAQVYADLQLSRGASRPVNADLEWKFDDPAEGITKFAERNQDRLDHFTRYVDLNPQAKILDIGARSGQLLYFLHDKGFEQLAGVDVVKLNVLWCKKNGFDVEVADVHELSSVTGTNRFKAIFAYHVLEHCYDPLKVLQEFYTVLVDDGAVHIEIPIGDVDLSKAHVYGFQKGELAELLRKAGFTVYHTQSNGIDRVVAGKEPLSIWQKLKLRLR